MIPADSSMNRAEERRWVRTLKAVKRYRADQTIARQVAALARELDRPVSEAQSSSTAAGDSRKMRGLPCIGRGIGGTQPGTDPLRAVLASERARA